MEIVVIAPHTELGVALTRATAQPRPATTGPRVIINVALQSPNTLLHDGHAWKRYPPARLARETRAALRVARDADFVVHASLLFAGAVSADTRPRNPLRAIIEAVLAARRQPTSAAPSDGDAATDSVVGSNGTDVLHAPGSASPAARSGWLLDA